MLKTKSVSDKLTELGCRDIYLEGFANQLYHPNTIYMVNCWGIQRNVLVGRTEDGHARGVLLKVNGMKWKQWVYITLNFLDYYDVYLLNDNMEVFYKTDGDGIFCEDLVETIDKLIES